MIRAIIAPEYKLKTRERMRSRVVSRNSSQNVFLKDPTDWKSRRMNINFKDRLRFYERAVMSVEAKLSYRRKTRDQGFLTLVRAYVLRASREHRDTDTDRQQGNACRRENITSVRRYEFYECAR